MPHEVGAYLGGIRSVEDLRARCRIDVDTGCWHWSLNINQGAPRVWVRTPETTKAMRGRQAALVLSRGMPLPSGHVCWARVQCKAFDCVNPMHCKSGPKKEWGREVAERGSLKGRPAKARASREVGVKRRSLTGDQAAMVRHSDATALELSAQLGVSRNLIYAIRSGRRYTEAMQGASVFNWDGKL